MWEMNNRYRFTNPPKALRTQGLIRVAVFRTGASGLCGLFSPCNVIQRIVGFGGGYIAYVDWLGGYRGIYYSGT